MAASGVRPHQQHHHRGVGQGLPLQAVLALTGHHAPGQAPLRTLARNMLLVPAFAFTARFQKWYPAYGAIS